VTGSRGLAILIGTAIAFFATYSEAAQPTLSKERVLFHTNCGDIVIALYPDVAPKHTQQILDMVKARVYEDVSIFRVEPGFLAQIDAFNPNARGVTSEQLQVVKNIPGEFSDIKHERGLISMARYDDPNSATSSFSFMLGSAPHLDGKYTILGEVVAGMDVLKLIEEIPTDDTHHPKFPINIKKTEIVDADALPSIKLEPAHDPEMPGGRSRTIYGIFAVLAFSLTVGTALWKTIFDKPPGQAKAA
jgi:cyclophilin family peptidyl-prolyl cis-trans isomerase